MLIEMGVTLAAAIFAAALVRYLLHRVRHKAAPGPYDMPTTYAEALEAQWKHAHCEPWCSIKRDADMIVARRMRMRAEAAGGARHRATFATRVIGVRA